MKKIRGKHICIVFLLSFLAPVVAGAFDFGAAVDQTFGTEGVGEKRELDYQASLLPHYSLLIGDSGDFYISAALNLTYKAEEFSFIPELLRTEFSRRFGGSRIKAGRTQYADPLGFIADGLFDGAQFLYDFPKAGTFSVGAWYTGLLYKKRANIMLSPKDIDLYYAPYNKDDFSNTYFAPSRLMFASDWEHSSFFEKMKLKIGVLGQVDLTETDNKDKYNSQYFAVKIGVPRPGLLFEAGGGLELIEYNEKLNIAFAGEAGIYWTLPTLMPSRLSFTGRFTSGMRDDTSVAAFTPVTVKPQGEILEAKLSGVSALALNYMIRLHKTFSADMTASYFLRSDTKTHQSYPLEEKDTMADSYLLGGELYGRLIWSPISDLRFTLGGGMFLPSLGDVAPKADSKWRVELDAVIVLY